MGRHLYGSLLLAGLALGLSCPARGAEAARPRAASDASPRFKTIYAFRPADGLGDNTAADAASSVYGTTFQARECGADCKFVFRLTPPDSLGSEWTLARVYGQEGFEPGPLAIKSGGVKSEGAVYGADFRGGQYGRGAIYRLAKSHQTWTYRAVYSFDGGPCGAYPQGRPLLAEDGTVYGTANDGPQRGGVVFKIDPAGKCSSLHAFDGFVGSTYKDELVFGKDGAIYGVRPYAGRNDRSFVYRITAAGAFSVLHAFDGYLPDHDLAVGDNGTIYGTARQINHQSATVWSLSPVSGKPWSFSQICVFSGDRKNGGFVRAGADLWGVAAYGTAGTGILYRLSPPATGKTWRFETVHAFAKGDPAGLYPDTLALKDGVLYGFTLSGGLNKHGAAFSYRLPEPPPHP